MRCKKTFLSFLLYIDETFSFFIKIEKYNSLHTVRLVVDDRTNSRIRNIFFMKIF
jgi:hypothetical protein